MERTRRDREELWKRGGTDHGKRKMSTGKKTPEPAENPRAQYSFSMAELRKDAQIGRVAEKTD